MNRRDFLTHVGGGALALAGSRLRPGGSAWAATRPAARRPNVLFLLTDDMGWADTRFAGHPYVKTPHLDRLASQSTWIQQFYAANPVCSPSRTAFMTSHFPARHHVHGHFATHQQNAARHMPDWLDPNVPFLPRLLRGAGYATAHFGKWHLGSGPGAPTPAAYGFDDWATVNATDDRPLGGADAQRDPFFRARSSRLIVDEAIRFMRAHREGPFYINAWTLLPHAPLNPTPEQLQAYAELDPRADNPAFGAWTREYLAQARNLKSQMRVFLASLTDLDEQVGRLMAALEELGLAENTLILFSSDNGPEDYHIGNATNAGVGSAGPLRARKRSLYEGGVRTECLVRWPGRVPAGRVDRESVVGAVDLLPTVCRLAGVDVPAGANPDGEDVSDILQGKSRPRARPLMWEWLFPVSGDTRYQPPGLAVRDGDWKLLVKHDGTGAELYDIPRDPEERHSLASERPEVVKRLTAQALAWQKTLPECPLRAQVPFRRAPAARPRPGAGRRRGAGARQ